MTGKSTAIQLLCKSTRDIPLNSVKCNQAITCSSTFLSFFIREEDLSHVKPLDTLILGSSRKLEVERKEQLRERRVRDGDLLAVLQVEFVAQL